MTRKELTKEEIQEYINNNDYTKLYSILFFGADKEKEIVIDKLFTVLENYNHIKNILK